MGREFKLSLGLAAALGLLSLHHESHAQQRPAVEDVAMKKTAVLVGTWRVSFTRPPARGLALVTFTSDGTSVRTTDRSPVMSPSHGAWQQIGEREFQATWEAFKFNASGVFIGSQKAIFRVSVNADGNSFTGVGIGTNYDLDGRLIESETAEGPFEGTRIAVTEHYTK